MSLQTIQPIIACFSEDDGVPIDCLFSKQLLLNQLIALFFQAIASCLSPSDCFLIQSITLCRIWILKFQYCMLLYCPYIVILLIIHCAIPSAYCAH